MNKEVSIIPLSYGNYVSLEDYIDLKKQLEEKEKIIDETLRLLEDLKDDIKLALDNWNKERAYQNAYRQFWEIKYQYEDIEKIVEVLERGKNGK